MNNKEIAIEMKSFLYGASLAILPKGIKSQFMEEAYVAGGAIRSRAQGESPSDYDIFLRSDKLVSVLRGANGFKSKNSVNVTVDGAKVQIITNEFGAPADVVGLFDFTCNMNYYDPMTDEVVIMHPVHVLDRILRVNPACRNKIGTLVRIEKFIKKGYDLDSRMSLLRLAVAISNKVYDIEDLIAESRLFFNDSEINEIREMGVEVPVGATSESINQCRGSGF